jgi:hypothetical protein
VTGPALTARLVRRSDLAAVVATLALSHTRHWQDQLNEPGSGALTLQADDPAHGLVVDGDIVQFLLDGTVVFGFIVRSRDHTATDPAEAVGQASALSGPGLLAVLDEAVVYPSPGVDSQPVQETRVFSWPAYDYDDAGWGTAAELATVLSGARGPSMPTGPLLDTGSYSYWADTSVDADNWPDPGAWFIWSTTGPGGAPISNPLEWAPAGDVYFRRAFTVPDNVIALQYHALFDAEGQVYLDGVAMADGDYGGEPNVNVFSGSIAVSPGQHVFAARLTNDIDPESDERHNPGGFALTAYAADAAGKAIGAGPVVHTDSSWKMLAYPDSPPGMTPGEALLKVIDEAQARTGGLPGLVTAFTGTVDSDGVPWPVVADIATQVGNDTLAFARELAATYLDVWMDPATMTLHAWVLDGRGDTRPVTLHRPTDPTDPMSGNLRSLIHRRVL